MIGGREKERERERERDYQKKTESDCFCCVLYRFLLLFLPRGEERRKSSIPSCFSSGREREESNCFGKGERERERESDSPLSKTTHTQNLEALCFFTMTNNKKVELFPIVERERAKEKTEGFV